MLPKTLVQNTVLRRPNVLIVMSLFSHKSSCTSQRLSLLLHHPNFIYSQQFHPAKQALVYLYKLYIHLDQNSNLWVSRFLNVSLQAGYNLLQHIGWVVGTHLVVSMTGDCSGPRCSAFQSAWQSPCAHTMNSRPSVVTCGLLSVLRETWVAICAHLLVPNRIVKRCVFSALVSA